MWQLISLLAVNYLAAMDPENPIRKINMVLCVAVAGILIGHAASGIFSLMR